MQNNICTSIVCVMEYAKALIPHKCVGLKCAMINVILCSIKLQQLLLENYIIINCNHSYSRHTYKQLEILKKHTVHILIYCMLHANRWLSLLHIQFSIMNI